CDQPVDELVGDAVLHDDPATGRALLAVAEICAEDGAFDRGVQISVGEHDGGALAAKLERGALKVDLLPVDDLAAGRGRSGERDLVDISVVDQSRAHGVAVAADDIDNAGWNTGFAGQDGE